MASQIGNVRQNVGDAPDRGYDKHRCFTRFVESLHLSMLALDRTSVLSLDLGYDSPLYTCILRPALKSFLWPQAALPGTRSPAPGTKGRRRSHDEHWHSPRSKDRFDARHQPTGIRRLRDAL
jgi:hypothetical protein